MHTPNDAEPANDTGEDQMVTNLRADLDLDTLKQATTIAVAEAFHRVSVGDPLLAQLIPAPDGLVECVQAAVDTVVDEMLANTAAKALRDAADALTEANTGRGVAFPTRDSAWLRDRADRIERGEEL